MQSRTTRKLVNWKNPSRIAAKTPRRVRIEPLEDRRMLTVDLFMSYVNDNWVDTNAPITSPPSVGDTVSNSTDTLKPFGTIDTKKFELPTADIGITGYGSAAYDDIQGAVTATMAGGAVTVLPGSYTATC